MYCSSKHVQRWLKEGLVLKRTVAFIIIPDQPRPDVCCPAVQLCCIDTSGNFGIYHNTVTLHGN